jgi:glutamate-ammonia-ligase adenylyltransferase
LAVAPVEAQLDALAALGLLPHDHATALQQGWEFLQRLSSRVRVVENRAVSDLDEERGDLDALARALGYPPTGRPGGARRALLADYHRHTNAVRAAYDAVMRSD